MRIILDQLLNELRTPSAVEYESLTLLDAFLGTVFDLSLVRSFFIRLLCSVFSGDKLISWTRLGIGILWLEYERLFNNCGAR